jgi:hypothetical protein
MAINQDPKQARHEVYADTHILNSSCNVLFEVIRDTYTRTNDADAWVFEGRETINRVMLNDDVLVNPETLLICTAEEGGAPAFSWILGNFAAEWSRIAAVIDGLIAANGFTTPR